MEIKAIALFFLVSGIILGAYCSQKIDTRNIAIKLICFLTPLSIVSVIGYLWSVSPNLMSDTWSQARLVPSIGLLQGYREVNALNSSPVQTWMYGPLATLSYLPVNLVAFPRQVMIAGGLLNSFFFFIPVTIFPLLRVLRKTQSIGKTIFILSLTFYLFFLSVTLSPSLSYSAFRVGPDAPSFFFAGIGIFFIYHRYLSGQKPHCYMFLSAAFIIMALWTKQNLLPLPIIIFSYIAFLEKRLIIALRYIAYCAISGILVSIPLIVFFGWKFIHFSMFEFPSAHPSWSQESTTFFTSILEGQLNDELANEIFRLITQSLPFLILFIACIVLLSSHSLTKFDLFLKPKLIRKARAACTQYPEFLLIIVSIGMGPMAILSKIKWGGDINSFSVCTYFLSIAFATLFADLLATLFFANSGVHSILRSLRLRHSLTLCLLFLMSISLMSFNPASLYQKGAASWYRYNQNPPDVEVAFSTIKELGNEVYFPDFPLASLLAKRQLFHSMKGIYDRKIGKFELTNEHLKSYLPNKFQFVAFGSELLIDRSIFQQDRVEEFIRVLKSHGINLQKVTANGALHDWIIYSRTP